MARKSRTHITEQKYNTLKESHNILSKHMSNSAIAKALSISDSTMSRITNSEDYQQYKQRLYEDNHRLYKKNHSTTTTTSTKDIQPTETVDEQYTLILKGVNLILEYQKDMIKELQEAKQQKRRIF